MGAGEFVKEYIRSKRAFYDIPYIKAPIIGSHDYITLEVVAAMVDEMGGTYRDFMLCQFRAYSAAKAKKFPDPPQLLTDNAVKRYKAYLIYNKIGKDKLYEYTSEEFKVISTGLIYDMKRVLASMSEDNIASYVFAMAKDFDINKLSQAEVVALANDVEYVIAKYSFRGKIVPEAVIQLRNSVRRILDETSS